MSRSESLREAGIRKYGSEAAWKAHMREIASKGGKVKRPETRTFKCNPDLARSAGAKGGRISRRNKNG